MNKRIRKRDPIRLLLCAAALVLFAVFISNLENLLYEVSKGTAGSYIAQVSTLNAELKSGAWPNLLWDVRRTRALDKKTIVDSGEYEAFADYYEAVVYRYLYEKDGRTERAAEWERKQKEAEKRLTAYRFRKAKDDLKEVFP